MVLTLVCLWTMGALLLHPPPSFEGRVTDASSGNPLPNVTVVVFRGDDRPGHWTTATDRVGRWTVPGLTDGRYFVTAATKGFKTFSSGWPPFRLIGDKPGKVVDIALTPGVDEFSGRSLLESQPSTEVRGRAVFSDGSPAQVSASVGVRTVSGSESRVRRSDGDTFITSVPNSQPTLVLHAVRPDGTIEGAVVTIQRGGTSDNLLVRLAPPIVIRGRAVAANRDAGSPAGLKLFAIDPPGQGGPLAGDSAEVQPDGRFEVSTFLREATIVVLQPARWEIHESRRNGRLLPDGVISLGGEAVDDVEVVLRRRASVIEGTVAGGKSSGVTILQRDANGSVACAAYSGLRDGEFETAPLPAGEYRVVAVRCCGGSETPTPLDILWSRATPVTLKDNETRRVRLSAPK